MHGVVVSDSSSDSRIATDESHGELAEQPPEDAGHQQDRQEYRDQRQAHRQYREADLLRAAAGRSEGRYAILDVPRDVLEHHDGIVDHEAGRDGQRHQRQVVQAEAEQIHDAESADQGHRHHHRRDQGGARIAQGNEHHEDHQQRGDQQGELDVMQRGTDRGGAIVVLADLDARWDRRPELRQYRVDALDCVDDVGAGLLVDDHHDRILAVGQTEVADILHAVGRRWRRPPSRTGALLR